MRELLKSPEFKQQFTHWIETSLRTGDNHLATSNQGTLLLYQQDGYECVVKAAMGTALLFQARLATLRREYKAYQKMQGLENIPMCFGLLEDRYLVLEYIRGTPYRHAAWDDRDKWFAELRQTIEKFHLLGVSHGDLKSKSNIIVTAEQKPCVIDFGTAIIYKSGLHPINHSLFKFSQRIDRNAWVKHKYQGDYSAAVAADQDWLKYSKLESVLRRFRRDN